MPIDERGEGREPEPGERPLDTAFWPWYLSQLWAWPSGGPVVLLPNHLEQAYAAGRTEGMAQVFRDIETADQDSFKRGFNDAKAIDAAGHALRAETMELKLELAEAAAADAGVKGCRGEGVKSTPALSCATEAREAVQWIKERYLEIGPTVSEEIIEELTRRFQSQWADGYGRGLCDGAKSAQSAVTGGQAGDHFLDRASLVAANQRLAGAMATIGRAAGVEDVEMQTSGDLQELILARLNRIPPEGGATNPVDERSKDYAAGFEAGRLAGIAETR